MFLALVLALFARAHKHIFNNQWAEQNYKRAQQRAQYHTSTVYYMTTVFNLTIIK